MINRLINFYHYTPQQHHESVMFCVWEGITRVYHKRLISVLIAKDEPEVEKALDEFVTSGGSHGMNHFPESYSMPNGMSDRSHLSDEALCIPSASNALLSDIAKSSTVYSKAAVLIRDINGGVPNRILEIGGGLGFLSVIMFRWGVKLYSGLDIPSNSTAAAFFSSRCCRPENIWLYGEPKDESKPVRFYLATEYNGIRGEKYDVIFNMNSFPEIAIGIQDVYLDLIADCLSPHGAFISINHEHLNLDQRSVSKAMKHQTKLVCESSNPSVILDGYFDEIYRLK